MNDHNPWRLLPFITQSAALNMATDEAILEHVAKKESLPTIRFYGWNPSAVSIGYFQSLTKEVRIESCRTRKIDIVRRMTGGGAVYHDNKGEITYSVIAPESYFSKGILESYHEIEQPIIDALNQLGITAEFAGINDLIVNGKKVSGNAQTRRKGVILQHGTILYDVDVDTMFDVLNVGEEKIRDKFISNVKERVTCLKSFGNFTKEDCLKKLEEFFSNGKLIESTTLSKTESELIKTIGKHYESNEWVLQR